MTNCIDFTKTNFTREKRERSIYETLRHKVHNFIIFRNSDENDYFDIGAFFKKYNVRKRDEIDNYIKLILSELTNSGWNCGTSFYKTGLFIFGDNHPPNFFPDTDEF